MEYRLFGKTEQCVSALGLGTMRLPLLDGDQGSSSYGSEQVDVNSSIRCIHSAIEQGINYIDTAYNYMGGRSEEIVGMALAHGLRDQVYIATKSPTWLIHTEQDFDRILSEQLEKLQTDHIDFYLLHSLNETNWQKVKQFDLLEKIQQAKASGTVRFIGFSFHDEFPLFREIVDSIEWDFCQIQLNYIDTAHQAGLEGLYYAAQKGLGVSIMEPLRGGYLVHPPESVVELLRKHGRTPIGFALEYLWQQNGVSLILSGMCSPEQITENIRYQTFPQPPLSDNQMQALAAEAAERIHDANLIGCTGCRYCVSGCPASIPIPDYFQCYDTYLHGNDDATKDQYRAIKASPGVGTVQQCLTCHHCETICPQKISIIQWLKKIDHLLR